MSDLWKARDCAIRIGIVDDHAITRRALCDFLSEQEGFDVVGQGSSGRDAMELARAARMDVMLLDIDMPGQNGIDALPHILSKATRLRFWCCRGIPRLHTGSP